MKRPAIHVINALCSSAWAIQEEWLVTMLNIAMRDNMDVDAVAAQLGRPLDNTRNVETRDGVAVIPITGPIFRYADMFTEISGATSIASLATDFTTALRDASVQSIVFSIDSPGGEVNGTNEFAQMVYDARGVKPITAYVSHLAASAAYWIASACDDIVCDPTATLGNIGVVATLRDPAKSKDLTFVSSQSPNKRPDPTTERGKSSIQAHVDALADVFIDAVARNRNTTAPHVIDDFGGGDVFVGQHAVDVGLADRLGSYESLLTAHQTANRAKILDRSYSLSESERLRAALSLRFKERFHASPAKLP